MVQVRRIAVIGGDGIGPEVTAVGRQVLEARIRARGLPLELHAFDLSADRYLRDGTTLPPDVLERIRGMDAVLLGALGDPRVPDMRHARDILFGLRLGLDLCCNIRPAQCLADRLMPLAGRHAADCRMVVFRENTEGEYAETGTVTHRGTPMETAVDTAVHTRRGVERVVRAAFAHARTMDPPRIHLADKHNALPAGHGLWHRVFQEVADDHPDVEAHHLFVDTLCARLVQDPGAFRVIVTTNLLGDIVSDLAAALEGGLGLAPSASVHPGRGLALFEPVHGSAPDLAGRDLANPLAMVRTVGMMLGHLGWPDERDLLEQTCRAAIEARQCTPDVGGELGTTGAAQWLLQHLDQSAGVGSPSSSR
jgi:3-isopropylmalate dehydrogenase